MAKPIRSSNPLVGSGVAFGPFIVITFVAAFKSDKLEIKAPDNCEYV